MNEAKVEILFTRKDITVVRKILRRTFQANQYKSSNIILLKILVVFYLDVFIADRPWDPCSSQINNVAFVYLNYLILIFQKLRSHSKEAKLKKNKNSLELKHSITIFLLCFVYFR